MANRYVRRDRRQAQREARLKYGPQIDALSSILADLKVGRDQDIRGARQGARMIERSARAAIPVLENIRATAKADPATSLVQSELAGLPEGSPFATAVKIGTSGAQERSRGAHERAGQELVARQADARSGGVQEERAIRGRYRQDRAQTESRLQGILGDAGLYSATRFGDLRQDAADRSIRRSSQRETARANRERESIQRDRMDKQDKPKPKKWATPVQQGAMQDNINGAKTAAEKLKGFGLSRQKAAKVLMDEAAALEFGVPYFGNKQLVVSSGLDVAYDGHLSKRNVNELRKRRIRVKKLGFKLSPKTTEEKIRDNEVAGPPAPRVS